MIVGDVVVLLHLPFDPKRPHELGKRLPPRIGLVVRLLEGGRFTVKLRMGGFSASQSRWCPRSRPCLAANYVRPATRREQETGQVIDPLPAAVAA